jgi:hypothetical protein
MTAQRASAAEREFVDAVARRVVELLDTRAAVNGAPRPNTADDAPCLTVAEVAARYRVSRSWVYAHQRQLGAYRMGPGPRARLRFDPDAVASAIAALANDTARGEQRTRERDRGRELRLIPFEPVD